MFVSGDDPANTALILNRDLETLNSWAKKWKVDFNPGKSKDFLPRFVFNKLELDVVEETKLLGVIIRNDLSWGPNTNHILQKANRKLWCLYQGVSF